MKKVLFIAILLFIALPVSGALAESNNIIEGLPAYNSLNFNTTPVNETTDNNVNTFYNFSKDEVLYIELPEPTIIENISFVTDPNTSTITYGIYFLNEDKRIFSQSSGYSTDMFENYGSEQEKVLLKKYIPDQEVHYIGYYAFYRYNTTNFREIKVYGKAPPPPEKYENGYFDNYDDYTVTGQEIKTQWIDNDITTGDNLIFRGTTNITFDSPKNITGIYFNGNNNGIIYTFTNGEGTHEIDLFRGLPESGYLDLNLTSVTSLSIRNNTGDLKRINEIELFIDDKIYPSIDNLKHQSSYNSISLSWDNPADESFIGAIIRVDGNEIKTVEKNQSTFTIPDLEPETNYKVDVIAKYSNGAVSAPVTINAETSQMPELEDVKNVTAKADYNRVDLSWELPETPTLKHVNIYRDVHEEKSFLMRLFSSSTTGATTKIFETNGTYFNDLTVEPKTTYDYTLTTTDGYKETEGVDVRTTTPAAPVPDMGGVVVEPQPNGDYLYKWETPKAGQVKIIVGGKEYTTVPAEGQQFLIPAADMKYTGLGKPDVGLVPINEYGDEGTPLEPEKDLDEVELPFNVVDLLKSGVSLLLILGPFVLLSLAFILFPRLRDTIKQGFINHKERRARNGSYRNN